MSAATLHQALALISPLYIVAGTLAGYLVGIIPGLGPAAGITLLLPLTYYMSPAEALIFYASLYQSAEYSGSITAIAVSTPGTPNAAATVLDGFAMNRQGRIGKAFAYSLWSAVFASLIGTAGMVLLGEPLARLALYFGPMEYAALGILGLSCVSILSSEYPLRGLLSAVFGLLLSTVGLDLISGQQRFTFGIPSLFDGLPLVALLTGLFALPEAITLLTEQQAGFGLDRRRGNEPVWLRWGEFLAVFPVMCLGTGVGFVMGLVPGLSGSVPPWIAYNLARLTSRQPETFGHGAPAGLVAPEATNAAVMHSTLLPALSFGIPGTPTSAVIIGAMMLSGLTPGPMLFADHPEVPYAVFASLFLATVFLWLVGLIATNVWTRILAVPAELLAVAVILFVMAGSYVSRTNLFDPQLAVVAGIVGYMMKKSHFSAPALVVGFILGPIIETNIRRALLLSGGSIGGAPGVLSTVLLLLALLTLVFGIRQSMQRASPASPPRKAPASQA